MTSYIGRVLFEEYRDIKGKEDYREETQKVLKVLEDYPAAEYNRVIAEKADADILTALSHIRENIVSWLPIRKTDKVLEIGTDNGALTGALCSLAGKVTVSEPDKERALVCATRHQGCENLSVHVGSFELAVQNLKEKYDWIILVESFERAGEEISGEFPHERLLCMAGELLSGKGKIVVGCANRFGLKYMAGNREESTDTYFRGLEGYEDEEKIRTFSRPELLLLAQKCGYDNCSIYYPYPDLSYTMSVYSDDYLPKVGELWDNLRNYKEERYVLFDETKAFDNVIRDGYFPIFSNAFLMILDKERNSGKLRILYTKHSNERGRSFAIRTDICEREDGSRVARKSPCYEEGRDHVNNLLKWQEELNKVYADTPILLNKYTKGETGVEMEYLTGQTLEEELDLLLMEGKKQEAVKKFLAYIELIKKAGSTHEFKKTDAFEHVFGEVILPGDLSCSPVTDIDMVAGNVIRQGDRWIHMDYEWTFDFPIPVNYVIYRIIQNFMYGNVERTELAKERLYQRAGLSKYEIEQYRKMEESFQKYITEGNVPLRLLYDEVSPGCISFAKQDALRRANIDPEKAKKREIEVFVEGFVLADTCIFVSGWAVNKGPRDITFSLCDGWGRELKNIGLEHFLRRDVYEKFNLNDGKRYAGFTLQCEVPDKKTLRSSRFTLFAKDGKSETAFEIPVGKLRIKQSVPGKIAMQILGKKDGITYERRRQKDYLSKNGKAKLENLTFDSWLLATALTESELEKQKHTQFPYRDAFTVVILGKEQDELAKKTAGSLEAQTCKAADIIYKTYDQINPDEIKGTYVFFVRPGDTFTKDALYEFAGSLKEGTKADIIYSDSDKLDPEKGKLYDPQFKPDWAPVTLQSGNYIGSSVCFSRELLKNVGMPDGRWEAQAIFELLLRCVDVTDRVLHISKILYHEYAPLEKGRKERNDLEGAWEKGRQILLNYYQKKQIPARVGWADFPLRYQSKLYWDEKPLVSVIIPNQDHISDLDLCLSSICERSTYENMEILVVENNSREKETFAYYEKMQKKYPKVRLLHWEREFNYSAINNYAVREAKGEYLIFLNNDTEILTEDWIEEMLSVCHYNGEGVVGVKLYYPDGTLQHAGVIIGLSTVAGHLYVKEPGNLAGYMGRIVTRQNLSAVTAACMMSSRKAFECVGGFDERLQVALNDVDFCLKCVKAGYPVIYDPLTELYHYESKSRGLDTTPQKKARYDGEVALFLDKWQYILDQGDPFYNVNLSRTTWSCALRVPQNDR